MLIVQVCPLHCSHLLSHSGQLLYHLQGFEGTLIYKFSKLISEHTQQAAQLLDLKY